MSPKADKPEKIWHKVFHTLREWWQWLDKKSRCDGNHTTDKLPPYTNCMNCGTELIGMYCHKCGQYASPPKPTIFSFVKEYIKNIFSVERQIVPTLSNLIFHPGRLVLEFYNGRYASYLHPLKLHFFILIVLFTLFAIFKTDAKISESFSNLKSKINFATEMTIQTITDDSIYLSKALASPRDTVKLIASQDIIQKHGNLIDLISVISLDTKDQEDTLIVALPSILKTDKLVINNNGVWQFSAENHLLNEGMMLTEMETIWANLTSFIFGHFPLLALLTAPLLMIAIHTLLRRKKRSRTFTSIFSIYYLAFMELVFTTAYITGICFDFAYADIRNMVLLVLFIHLTVALKRCYNISSWFNSVLLATIVNIFYFVFCIIFISVISIFIIITTIL